LLWKAESTEKSNVKRGYSGQQQHFTNKTHLSLSSLIYGTMKNNFLLLLLSVIYFQQATAQVSCCASAKSPEMAMMNDPAFTASHAEPLPFEFVASTGSMITINTPDSKKANAFYVKVEGTNNVVFMFHEWWGLNDYIKREAEVLSKKTGASVLALDLFDGKVTSNADEAAELFKNADEERIRAIISGAIDFAGRNSRIQTIGWCLGGKWSLQAAMMGGPNVKGCVMYYGFPEQDKSKIAKISFPVLGIFASKDDWITPQVVDGFKNMMEEQKKPITIYNYDAVHAFANPSNPKHDAKAASEAMEHSLTFIKSNFK
jgi:carboxymethylenebutenolidase